MTRRNVVRQCRTCPWRVGCVPECDIPGGYTPELHAALASTIRSGLESLEGPLPVMACRYSPIGEEIPCAGWLAHQLGPGNNLATRLAVSAGRLPVPVVDGPQHERFEDTLPGFQPELTEFPIAGRLARRPKSGGPAPPCADPPEEGAAER